MILPHAARAQQDSTIEAEVSPGQFTFCGSRSEPVMLPSILTDPAMPSVGAEVMFRIRKNSLGTPSDDLNLDTIVFAPSVSGPFQERTQTQVSFNSSPPLSTTLDAGSETFDMFFVPSEEGVYRFTFSSDLWDGGSCSVDITVSSSSCLISGIEGLGPSSVPAPNELDFGAVPVGEQATGMLLFTFSEPFPSGEGIAFTAVEDPPFHLAQGFALSPSGLEGTWDVAFQPDSPGVFEDIVGFIAVRDQGHTECFLDVRLAGVGDLAGVSVVFDDPVCGDDLEISGVIRNPGTSPLQNLALSAPAGYQLSAVPAGSYDPGDFSLGALGSQSPPAERRFLLRFVGGGGSAEHVLTVRRNGEVLTERPIPQAACIEIVEPADLTLNYGDVVVNNAAPVQSILVANHGNQAATVAANLASSGPGQGFGIGLEGAVSATLSLPPASEELLPVSFTPPSPGAKSSSVGFSSSQFSGIPSVSLIGNGVDQPTPSLSFQVNGTAVNPGGTIRFPATELGQSSTLPLTITNNGNLAALGLGLNAVNGEFNAAGTPPAELGPGQSANFTLSFQPQQTGTRNGQLTVTSDNLDPFQFTLTGEGSMGELTINGIGLNTNVSPGQTPLPTVGLELAGGGAAQPMEGDLILEFVPNLPQTPNGFNEAYQAVRFMTGSGPNGRTMRFMFREGESAAVFPSEGDAPQARYQTGSVAGSIQFRVANLQTTGGAPVSLEDPDLGGVTVGRLAPSIRSMTTPQTSTGITVIVEAVSTTREITGVCLTVNAAPNTDLSFTRPDAAFLNERFVQWFNGGDSFPFGGDFRLAIPIDFSDIRTFGSASVALRNSEGWSASNPCQ